MFAAYGDILRDLCVELNEIFKNLKNISEARLIIPGIICLQVKKYTSKQNADVEINDLKYQLEQNAAAIKDCPVIIICDDAAFTSATLNNFLWVTFTRCNPSHDIDGVNGFYENKHWGCDNLIIDARIKPHHAPVLEKDVQTEKNIERLFNKGGSLYGVLK